MHFRMTKKWIDVYSERVRGLFLDKENQEFMKVKTCETHGDQY